jgi:ferredoxin-NADP reductase
VALIAGGIGITPVRALLEDLPGDVAVVYRVAREEDVILRSELDRLAHVHYVVGELSAERLLELVPDLAERDVFVCGPPSVTEAVRATGVRRVFVERFAL